MKNFLEKTVEFVSREDGISMAVRPLFPFVAEGFRQRRPQQIEIFGQGKVIAIDVPEDIRAELAELDQLDLCEFPVDGAVPVRELILSKSPV